jgi:hypothetical protein
MRYAARRRSYRADVGIILHRLLSPFTVAHVHLVVTQHTDTSIDRVTHVVSIAIHRPSDLTRCYRATWIVTSINVGITCPLLRRCCMRPIESLLDRPTLRPVATWCPIPHGLVATRLAQRMPLIEVRLHRPCVWGGLRSLYYIWAYAQNIYIYIYISTRGPCALWITIISTNKIKLY